MGSKKYDIIQFKGKYVDETFQVDRDLQPNSRDRTDFINDCFVEWDYWTTMAKKKEEEKYKNGDKDE